MHLLEKRTCQQPISPCERILANQTKFSEFQFVSGPPQAQHGPRTAKYFTKTCVRGPRNIFNENIRKQEFGVSKTPTSPSEHIPSKTELSLSPCVHRVPIGVSLTFKHSKNPSVCIPLEDRTKFESNFLTTKNSAGQHSYRILIAYHVLVNTSPRKPNQVESLCP